MTKLVILDVLLGRTWQAGFESIPSVRPHNYRAPGQDFSSPNAKRLKTPFSMCSATTPRQEINTVRKWPFFLRTLRATHGKIETGQGVKTLLISSQTCRRESKRGSFASCSGPPPLQAVSRKHVRDLRRPWLWRLAGEEFRKSGFEFTGILWLIGLSFWGNGERIWKWRCHRHMK